MDSGRSCRYKYKHGQSELWVDEFRQKLGIDAHIYIYIYIYGIVDGWVQKEDGYFIVNKCG
jgi:hypothetical protein